MQQYRSDKQGEEKSTIDLELAMIPQVSFMKCPIKTSLGVLGKKWTMLIIRDIGVYKITRFNRLLESIESITPRVLSMRLKELEKKGFIECSEEKRSPMIVQWRLTEKGKDTLPILMQLVAFGSKWYFDVVFEDKKPRKLTEIFPNPLVREIIMGIT
ncbi:MAG: winged helix-turn-helix transcriptional regulator [Nitrososphaeraceae archaeon]